MKGSKKGIAALSEREREALKFAGQGLTDDQISRELGIAKGTLATYWERIRAKTGLSTRAELTAAYERHRFESLLVWMVDSVAEVVTGARNGSLPKSEPFLALPIATLVVNVNSGVVIANRLAVRLLGLPATGESTLVELSAGKRAPMLEMALINAAQSDEHSSFACRHLGTMGSLDSHWIIKALEPGSDLVLVLISAPMPERGQGN